MSARLRFRPCQPRSLPPSSLHTRTLPNGERLSSRHRAPSSAIGSSGSTTSRPGACASGTTSSAARCHHGRGSATASRRRSSLRAANECDVILSTVDRVGIPLILLGEVGIVRRPIVYTAIGLPERLVQLRGTPARRLYRRALRRTRAIVSYAESEVAWLRDWLGPGGPPAVFIPFGVDVHAFHPGHNAGAGVDVVSVGADPHRDFNLLVGVAARHPELMFQVVATEEWRRVFGELPGNVSFESGLSLEQVRDRLGAARVVALPVQPNSYSGATTVLLQAMALAKPVVVSRTDAIAAGYGLEDRTNCRLVEPGDPDAFEQALLETLADPGTLGARARETVERGFSWERYTSELWKILSG